MLKFNSPEVAALHDPTYIHIYKCQYNLVNEVEIEKLFIYHPEAHNVEDDKLHPK